jgi:hypothetical protein
MINSKILSFLFTVTVCSCDQSPTYITPSTNDTPEKRQDYIAFIGNKNMSTDGAQARAQKDFENEKYFLIEYGEILYDSTIKKNLEKVYRKYNVRIELGGCVVTEAGEAYTNEMIALLVKNNAINIDTLYAEAWVRK